MKNKFKLIYISITALVASSLPVFGAEMNNSELVQELTSMKEQIEKLETALEEKDDESSKQSWIDNFSIGGVVEIEAGHESMDYSDPAGVDTDSSDIALATVALGIDAEINKHISGHVLLLWEEDDTEPVDIDEGFISVNGGDAVPLYLDAGRMYVPFGAFESHFINDPLTLEIGETRESTVKMGYSNDIFNLSVSLFNGDIDEFDKDVEIGTFAASAAFILPEETVPEFDLIISVSYISNIADSDGLEGEVLAGAVHDNVPGLGLFASASIMNMFFIEAEYLGATDRFAPGELSFDNGFAYKPRAYNLELAWAVKEEIELGIKYEGSKDLGDFLPEKQYGCVLNYGIFKNTGLGIEYLHGEYENNDERDLVTAQFTIEF